MFGLQNLKTTMFYGKFYIDIPSSILNIIPVNVHLFSIDPMHKWRRFESFVCIEISPTSLVLELNFQKNMLPKMRLVGQI